MTTQSRMFPRLGGLGIVFAALFVATFVLTGNEPGTGASGATVVKYYHEHHSGETAAVFVVAAAVLAFAFFIASLRRRLAEHADGRDLAPVVTIGAAVLMGGLLLMGALTIALVDAAHYQMTGAAQTLNVLSSDVWVPVVVGLSLGALGTGVSALRSAALPGWLSWASIGLGVLAVAGPLGAVAFLITPLWALATGIVLIRSSGTGPRSELAAGGATAHAPSLAP